MCFLVGGEEAIAISVEQADDIVIGLFPATIFENPDVGVFGNGSLDLLCQLNRAVVWVVMVHESAYETDYDIGRSRDLLGSERRGIPCAGHRRHSRGQDGQGDNGSAK